MLRDDGVIFINIDNTEAHNLHALLDEIFGAENFIDCIVWQKRVSPSNDAKWFSSDHDYILVYARNKEIWRPRRLTRSEKQSTYYKNPDNDPRGPWNSATYTCNKSKEERPNLYYPITNPNTHEEIWPKETAVWKYSREKHLELVAQNLLYWGIDGQSKTPRLKQFLSEAGDVVPRSIWGYSEVGHTQEATSEYLKLFAQGGFDSPKPTRLIKRMLQIATTPSNSDGDIVVDFFAGSCTTAQAVLSQNRDDEGSRRFIVVQLPEPTGDTEFPTIAEIGKERIRRVITRMQQDKDSKFDMDDQEEDLGFKVYRLDRSNFRQWESYEGSDLEAVQARFDEFETPLVDDWQPDDLLAEIVLLQGFPLDSRMTTEQGSNTLYTFTSDDLPHRLIVCLDDKITDETIEGLQTDGIDVVVLLDSALTDQSKMRLADRCTLRVI
jgi:adenine-specific DNA-methyltransferase